MLTLWLFAAVYYDQARIQGAIDKTTKKIDCSKISSSCGITVELCAGLRDKPGNLHLDVITIDNQNIDNRIW